MNSTTATVVITLVAMTYAVSMRVLAIVATRSPAERNK